MNLSFSMTTEQVRNGTKDVTRRKISKRKYKPGMRLWAVEKGQGLKKGEKVKRIREIEIVSVTEEPLYCVGAYVGECKREGFPGWHPRQFIAMFCKANGCDYDTIIQRIVFKYVEGGAK